VLEDDGRIGYQRPEIVRFEARVSLQILKKGGLIRVIVRIYSVLLASRSLGGYLAVGDHRRT
jgi:hypothetical protein